ncbi:MAG: HlyD family efflux transporter periplasmic adaptor subunit [Actinobacteria bacterium]|nr:HlyD family efflux transporter periplasmic adaptor subunit [Actinomycetota bacterium]
MTADARNLQQQSSLLAAQQTLGAAETALSSATLTAPISGQVAAVPFTVGTTESTASAITIVAPGATQLTVNIPASALLQVKVGQKAKVTPSGQAPLDATVQRVGILPNSAASASTTTYPVVVLVPSTPAALSAGARAQVSIVTNTIAKGLVVPLSAITRTGATTGTAHVLNGDTVTTTSVGVGAVGSETVQLTSGVKAGDQLVLADVQAALPGNSTQANNRLGSAAGGVGGSGAFGGAGGTGVGGGGNGAGGGAGNGGARGGAGGRPGG